MSDVLNLQDGDDTPGEEKKSDKSLIFCAGSNKSNGSWAFC